MMYKMNINSIPKIIFIHIAKIEEDIKTLAQDKESYLNCHKYVNPDREYHTKWLSSKLGFMMPFMIESLLSKLEEEKKLYENAFTPKMIQSITDSFENINIFEESLPINKSIIHARIEILRFSKSGLGEKDYSRDINAVKNKIDDVSKYTEVYSNFNFPALPHITLKELVFYLCNTKKNRHIYPPLPIILKKTAKEISMIISEKQRLPRDQKEYDRKELSKVAFRSRHGMI